MIPTYAPLQARVLLVPVPGEPGAWQTQISPSCSRGSIGLPVWASEVFRGPDARQRALAAAEAEKKRLLTPGSVITADGGYTR